MGAEFHRLLSQPLHSPLLVKLVSTAGIREEVQCLCPFLFQIIKGLGKSIFPMPAPLVLSSTAKKQISASKAFPAFFSSSSSVWSKVLKNLPIPLPVFVVNSSAMDQS